MVDDSNGLLFPPRDVEALAGRLDALIGDPGCRARLAATARDSIVDIYDEHVVLTRFTALLSSLVKV